MLELRAITKQNWYQCTQLKITDEQRGCFPVPPVYWLAECRYMPDWYELAIYDDNMMIGFTVYGFDPDNKAFWINALMIDKNYQGKGFGKSATQRLIEKIRKKHNAKNLYIGHRLENHIAASLYESLGFMDTGERHNGEVIRCKKL